MTIEPGLPPPADSILEVRDLHVVFETDNGIVEAVNGVSFDLRRGKILAIVGESGSGKSVTAYSVMRLIQKPGRISAGSIRLNSRGRAPLDITALRERDEELYRIRGDRISMIFQEPMTALSPVHRIGDQICEAILLHRRISRADASRQAIEMLEKVGIPDAAERMRQYPHEFSGGMRQRVVIAMALVCRPEILIADEPTTALDVTIQAQILGLIRHLQRHLDTSVLFITHDMGVVAQIADEVAVMYAGRIVERGTVRQVLKNPLHPYTQGLLAAIPSAANPQRRLPTVEQVVGDRDITTPYPLVQLADGRLVGLPEDELRKLEV